MAYDIIDSRKYYGIGNGPIYLLKYNILKNGDKFYLQLKLKNTSENIITKFVIKYSDANGVQFYNAENLSIKPGILFFGKTLIPLPSEHFEFIGFEKVFGKKFVTINPSNNPIDRKTTLWADSNLNDPTKYNNSKEKNSTYNKKDNSILVIDIFIGLLVFCILVSAVLSRPWNGILFSSLIRFPDFFDFNEFVVFLLIQPINIAIFVLLLVRFFIKNKQIKYKLDSTKKNLVPCLMWMITLFILAIENSSIIFLIAGLCFLLYYVIKRRSLSKRKKLIKRKITILCFIPTIILARLQCSYGAIPTINLTPKVDVEINGVRYANEIISSTEIIMGNETTYYYYSDIIKVKDVNKKSDKIVIENEIYIRYEVYSYICIDPNAFKNCNANTIVFKLPGVVSSDNTYIEKDTLSYCDKIENLVFEDCINLFIMESEDIFETQKNLNIYLDISEYTFNFYLEEYKHKNYTGIYSYFKDNFNIYYANEWTYDSSGHPVAYTKGW